MRAARPPIFIIGLPRSGTTWVSDVLRTAADVRYSHEPFNYNNYPKAEPYRMRYLRAADEDERFERLCRAAFEGRTALGTLVGRLRARVREVGFVHVVKGVGRRLARQSTFAGSLIQSVGGAAASQLIVKDVHVCLALDWIDRHVRPRVVVVTRHPCAILGSWLRLGYRVEPGQIIHRLRDQPALFEDHLGPWADCLAEAREYAELLAVCWGATYLVLARQGLQHPSWQFVRHEDLCADPRRRFRELFDKLDLEWTPQTEEVLHASTTRHSDDPYVPQRLSALEPEKWRSEVSAVEVAQVMRFAPRFRVPQYPELYAESST